MWSKPKAHIAHHYDIFLCSLDVVIVQSQAIHDDDDDGDGDDGDDDDEVMVMIMTMMMMVLLLMMMVMTMMMTMTMMLTMMMRDGWKSVALNQDERASRDQLLSGFTPGWDFA